MRPGRPRGGLLALRMPAGDGRRWSGAAMRDAEDGVASALMVVAPGPAGLGLARDEDRRRLTGSAAAAMVGLLARHAGKGFFCSR